jgi:hypothetical protein
VSVDQQDGGEPLGGLFLSQFYGRNGENAIGLSNDDRAGHQRVPGCAGEHSGEERVPAVCVHAQPDESGSKRGAVGGDRKRDGREVAHAFFDYAYQGFTSGDLDKDLHSNSIPHPHIHTSLNAIVSIATCSQGTFFQERIREEES